MNAARGIFVTIALLAWLAPGTATSADTIPLAWMRLGDPAGQTHEGTPYHFLGDGPLFLRIEVPPADGQVLDFLAGAKDDQREAFLEINGETIRVKNGGHRGFQWIRVKLPAVSGGDGYDVAIRPGEGKAAFYAAARLTTAGTPVESDLPAGEGHGITFQEPPPTELTIWAEELREGEPGIQRRAQIHGLQASEALRRCRKYIDGWHAYSDPVTGLIPRNLQKDRNIWNGKDSAADNYAFMVLTAALTDRELLDGRMLEILKTEEKVATRAGGLPVTYNFEKQQIDREDEPIDSLIFNGSEYVKDGLMPITEWMGETPWSGRMIRIVDSLLAHAPHETAGGKIPSDNVEVNGEMMQVLSRLCFMAENEAYLDMACRIADYYLLGDRRPTRDAEKLGLRDHNCELISGLTEVYAACHFARKEKAEQYRQPIHDMLDDILKVAVNEHGLMYDMVNPRTGEILRNVIGDNWGYNYNGFHTVYLLDKVEKYREATRFALSNLKEHYWKFAWQGWGSDGIADSVEGAINLFNREPDVPGVADWIDANINRMLEIQKPDGVIEGWHGDGNYARTAILWVLWKQQGVTIQPWRPDVKLGAVREGDVLHLSLSAEEPWEGRLIFDRPRHRAVMKLPLDYPRINQFPEWFTVEGEKVYEVATDGGTAEQNTGATMAAGLPVKLPKCGQKIFKVEPAEK